MTSSFNSLNQLSCNVSISNTSKSFCSGVNFSTHFFLSQLEAGAAMVEVVAPVTFCVGATVLGGPKKAVIEPLALGFLASVRGRVAALRFSDMMSVQWMMGRDTLKFTDGAR